MTRETAKRVQAGLLLAAVIISCAALLLQRYSLNKSLTVDANTAYLVSITDDRPMGGKSLSNIVRTDEGYLFTCKIDTSYDWPFCQLSIEFSQAPNGLNLSGYENIELDVSIQGPGEPSLRVYLRNFNPAYASPQRPTTFKVNEVEYNTANYDGFLTLPLSTFSVPAWWRINNNVDISYGQPEFDNITFLELATGSVVRQGTYTINMRSVTFTGKLISQNTILILLLIMWIALAMMALLTSYIVDLRKLRAQHQRRQLLEEIEVALGTDSSGPKYDPVTGLGTRRYLRGRIIKLIQESEQRPSSAILFEIDHHCDYYHQDSSIQESLLADLARLIKQNTREQDITIRWHSTQFIVICPATTTAQTIHLAEKIRLLCEQTKWRDGLQLTLSAGVVQHSHTSIKLFSEVLTQALHRARNEGGNKTVALLIKPGEESPKLVN